MRVKVTTEIDINLKRQYEAVRVQSSKTYRGILEAGIIAELRELDPIGALKARIELHTNELTEARAELARLRVIEPLQKRIVEYEVTETARQARIGDWLDQQEPGTIKLIKQGSANWKRLAHMFDAATPQQAQQWLMEVVKSRQAKREKEVHI